MGSIEYTQLNSRQLIHRSRFIESWFPLRYSLDVYSGCEYSCPFCRVNWKSEKKIIVKKNVVSLLKRELSLLEESLKSDSQIQYNRDIRNTGETFSSKILVGVGGGFNEVFSPINQAKKYSDEVIRELVKRGHLPLVVTQNPGYFLERIEDIKDIILVVSFTNLESKINEVGGELNLPSVVDKLRVIAQLVAKGVKVGGLVMPIVPRINDSLVELTSLFKAIKKAGVEFVLFDTIDFQGLQHLYEEKSHQFFNLTEKKQLFELFGFQNEFDQSQAINSFRRYQSDKRSEINRLLVDLEIFPQVPFPLIKNYLSAKDQVCVALGQMFYMEKMAHDYDERCDIKTAYKFASYSLNQITEEKYTILLKNDLWKSLVGVGDYFSLVIGQMARGNFSAYSKKLASLWSLHQGDGG